MTRFECGDVVRVPFPFVESDERRFRPALVVSDGSIGPDGLLIWVAMITNAKRPAWPGDVAIADHAAAGLPIPSMVRTCKLATLEASDAEPIGRLAGSAIKSVRDELRALLGLDD